jgi:hypothetical protein
VPREQSYCDSTGLPYWAKWCKALAEARAIVDKTGERWWEAELHRLEGELTLQKEFKVQGSKLPIPDP